MREPIIFTAETHFLRLSMEATEASEKESILRNFMTSGNAEKDLELKILLFI